MSGKSNGLRRDLSRRDFLIGLSAAMGAAAAACAGPAPSPGAATTPAPGGAATAAPSTPAAKAGGTLNWVTHQDIDMTDVHASFALITGMVLGRNVFDRLVEHDENLNIVPRLAERWDTSPDGKTWTFHLRQGVKFQDGTPFNAQAVKANIDRALNPDNKLLARQFAYGGVDHAEVADDYTIKLITTSPLAALLNNLADSGFGAIQSPKSLQEASGGKITPTGTGPFKFVSWTPGEQVVLQANPDYWDKKPTYDRLVVKPVPEPATRVNLLLTGEALIINQVPPQSIAQLKANQEVKVEVPPATSWQYIALDNQKPPFDDVRVRQAVNYAIDKQMIVDKLLLGVGRVADSPIGSAYPVHVDAGGYAFDVAKAKQLLSDAGWKPGSDGILEKDGKKFSVVYLDPTGGGYPGWPQIAQTVQSQLKAVGVDVKITTQEWATYLQTTRKPPAERNFDLTILSWGTADPDSGLRLTLSSTSWPPQGSNVALYKNPQVDQLIDQGASTIKLEDRKPIYAQIQQIVMKDAPWLFVSERREAIGWRSNVDGVKAIPSSAGLIDVRGVTVR